jgi:hypothetical protein
MMIGTTISSGTSSPRFIESTAFFDSSESGSSLVLALRAIPEET